MTVKTRASINISVLVPCQSPLLNVAGVGMLMLHARCTLGVEGTDKHIWTAVSILSASRVVCTGVLGFSCFCCTASSCRRSTKEATQSKPLEYVFSKIKTGENVLLRFFPLWRWSQVTLKITPGICSKSGWSLKAFPGLWLKMFL